MRNLQKGNEESTDILHALIPRISYKHWKFSLQELNRGQGCEGLTLVIRAEVPDSFGNGMTEFCHLMPVLPCAYDEDAWIGWVLEQILMVEKHESLEFFEVDGHKPFFPYHRPGGNPYEVHRVITEEQAHSPATPWSGGGPQDPHFQQ